MNKDLDEATAAENSQNSDYESLVAAKNKQKEALTKAIETKLVRVGELSVKLADTSNDLEDTQEQLAEDKKMRANLDTNCKTKQKEWEEYKKVMAQEQVALADTIKILNDDDALGLFKKTLPSASSFMQVQVTSTAMRQQAMKMLRAARTAGKADPRISFIESSMRKLGFG